MSLVMYIGLALLSWWPLVAGAMIVGGLVAFVGALVLPSNDTAPAPAAERERPSVAEPAEAPVAPAAGHGVPQQQRREERTRQAA